MGLCRHAKLDRPAGHRLPHPSHPRRAGSHDPPVAPGNAARSGDPGWRARYPPDPRRAGEFFHRAATCRTTRIECAAMADANISDIVVVLDKRWENDLNGALDHLKKCGMEVATADDDNS